MIPHESLGKEVYNVSSFGMQDALNLLISYPCVYYTCGEYERASEQAARFNRVIEENGIAQFIIIRRVGRRVVAERGPEFDPVRAQAGWDAIVGNAPSMPRYTVGDGSSEGSAMPAGTYESFVRSYSSGDWSDTVTVTSEDNE